MGIVDGFLLYQRKEDPFRPVQERVKDFGELYQPLNEESRREQAARCMSCGVPMCQSAIRLKGMVTGCPLHNLIPEWNDEIYRGHDAHALSRLLKTSNFPEFTGRVCPALCEKACLNGVESDPVTIHNNEMFLIETAYAKGYMQPRIPETRSGKKIAVVGSGPSGLACADQLNHRGHLVTVFEREDRIGGLLMYGIPNMKLDKSVVFRRQKLMEEEGVVFRTGVDVGRDITREQLLKDFDAVVMCCGAKKSRPLAAEGMDRTADIEGSVYYAVDFLKKATKTVLSAGPFAGKSAVDDAVFGAGSRSASAFFRGRRDLSHVPPAAQTVAALPAAEMTARGKHVVIVGGGDTGNDCTATSIRQGAVSVTQIEMMPEPPEKRLPSNPWPEWPKVKKTDYGQQEAIALFGHDPRVYETTVKKLIFEGDPELSSLSEESRAKSSAAAESKAVKSAKKAADKAAEKPDAKKAEKAEKAVAETSVQTPAAAAGKKLRAIVTVKVKFENGKLTEVAGTEKVLPCELLIIAAGFIGCEDYVTGSFDLPRSKRGTAETPEGSYKTSVDKIFTAGDMHRGQSLVVWAITEGRACAAEVDEYLMGYTEMK